eukprot:6309526-Amphidinium_carterae.1
MTKLVSRRIIRFIRYVIAVVVVETLSTTPKHPLLMFAGVYVLVKTLIHINVFLWEREEVSTPIGFVMTKSFVGHGKPNRIEEERDRIQFGLVAHYLTGSHTKGDRRN